MQKLQISYVTWTRSDANGLFDYEDLKGKKADDTLMIEQSGYICRRKQDYKLSFSASKVDQSKFEKILKVNKRDNNYLLKSLDITNQPLFKIIEQDYPKTHQIKKGDTIRLGKVIIQVLELKFNTKKRISPYALIKKQMENTQISAIRQITPIFYTQAKKDEIKMSNISQSQQNSLQSCFEQNPTCRYCYSKTVTLKNPFIVSCGCSGSAKYIHQSCLLEWFLRRGSLQQRPKAGVIFCEQKIFKCELCHKFFYLTDLWRKFFDYQKYNQQNLQGNAFQEVLILHVKYQGNWLYFIDLSEKRKVLIGRSLQNDVILNELSVSRHHAKLGIDSIEKVITLINNNAKFGTLVQIEKVQVQNDENYQVGRTKMSFKKHEKKSIFDKIGLFCFVRQKLNKEVPKNNRNSRMQMLEREIVKMEPQIQKKPQNELQNQLQNNNM